MKLALVRKGAYFDSVFLMSLGGAVKAATGVADAMVSMGTPLNLELLRDRGYSAAELAPATPNDLVIAVEAADRAAADSAVAAADELLKQKVRPVSGGAAAAPTSLEGALRLLPGANLAVISVPGAHAAREARKALLAGLHVMLFSDNVSLEDEVALKQLGRSSGLLVMGPDCGTAIVNGKPLCFANVVRRGPVGVVAASGTGLQEVTCLVDRLGSGVSQALGTGGRDLKNERVGGITMTMGIEALAQDPATQVIAILSKPPAPAVAARLIAALGATGKPAVAHFIGQDPAALGKAPASVRWAASLEEAAALAVSLAGGRADLRPPDPAALAARARQLARGLSPRQRHLRGYFTGGTLADEALFLLHRPGRPVHSNNQTDPAFVLADARTSVGHTIVDLGDDVFTVGRPHPMIDPSTRTERILAEAADPGVAVLLVDVVLGHGSHPDPAGALLPALAEARRAAEARGGRLPVVASVVGTPGDPQGYASQRAKLEEAGCAVMDSNHQAALLAGRILDEVPAP
ncbi:MAG TPA: acyl-CoA synthetase FdrA [Anaeromyxobacter sp.]|nr:acyl-CoA synthetase FdrA [Anaeromyxobacter sp.]